MIIEGKLADEVIALVTRIAQGELKDYCQHGDIPACHFCSWTSLELGKKARTEEEFNKLMETGVEHDADCLIVQARHILDDLGITYSLFRYVMWG